LISVLLPVFLAGCDTSTNQSDLKHEFGNLSSSPHKLTCTQSIYAGKEALYEAYIRRHIDTIMMANRDYIPTIFKPKDFCVTINPAHDANAVARDNGLITAFVGSLGAFDTHSDFAAQLSHEIAHAINAAEYLQASKDIVGDTRALDLLVADIALIEDRYAAFWHPANDGAGRSDKPSTPSFELKGRKLRDIRQRGDCCQAAPDTPSNNGAGSWCPARHSLDWLGFWGILLAIPVAAVGFGRLWYLYEARSIYLIKLLASYTMYRRPKPPDICNNQYSLIYMSPQ